MVAIEKMELISSGGVFLQVAIMILDVKGLLK